MAYLSGKIHENLTFINDLKLRASVGTTGTQNLTSFSNRDLYEATSYNNLSAIIHKQVGNRDIRWEKSTQYDLGLDFALFDYRLDRFYLRLYQRYQRLDLVI